MATVARFQQLATRGCKRGWEGYKTGSQYIAIPTTLAFGAYGAGLGFVNADKDGHGWLRCTACAFAYAPFFGFIGYGLAPVVIPITTAIGVGYLTGVVTVHHEVEENGDTENKATVGLSTFRHTSVRKTDTDTVTYPNFPADTDMKKP